MDLSNTPRVNGRLLPQYTGRHVMLMVESLGFPPDRGLVRVRASDGGDIFVSLEPGVRLEETYYQLIGKVVQNNIVEVNRVFPAGQQFDMEIYDKTIMLIHAQYQNMF